MIKITKILLIVLGYLYFYSSTIHLLFAKYFTKIIIFLSLNIYIYHFEFIIKMY